MNFELNQISGLISLVISLGTFILLWRKFPVEKKVADSSAAEQVTEGALALLPAFRERIKEQDTEIDLLTQELDAKTTTIREMKTKTEGLERELARRDTKLDYERSKIAMYIDWTDRLLDQLKKAGIEPASFSNGKKGVTGPLKPS